MRDGGETRGIDLLAQPAESVRQVGRQTTRRRELYETVTEVRTLHRSRDSTGALLVASDASTARAL